MELIKSSNSVTNYEPTITSKIGSIRQRFGDRRTSQEKQLDLIKNKYSAYRSNISNLQGMFSTVKAYKLINIDKRPVIPARSKTKRKPAGTS